MATTIRSPELTLRSIEADWNRERWEQLEADGNRYEVIDGVLYVTSSPGPFHQWIIQEANDLLRQQLKATGVAVVFLAPTGLFMPGCDPVQPDIMVIRREDLGMIHDKRIEGIPALLVEVLSPSNSRQDLLIKKAAYARAGVPEYWIIRPAERDVLVYSQPDPVVGEYTEAHRVAPDGELVSPTLPFRASIGSFFAGSPDTTI